MSPRLPSKQSCSFILLSLFSLHASAQYYIGAGMSASAFSSTKEHSVTTFNGAPVDVYSGATFDNKPSYGMYLKAGYRYSRYRFGLSYQRSDANNATGVIQQFSFAENYRYHYDVRTQAILANMSADLLQGKNWTPYVDIGMGVAMNEAYDFSEAPLSGVSSPRSLDYADNSKTDFAWKAGLGLRYNITKVTELDLQYHYVNFGGYQLGQASSNPYQGTGGRLKGNEFSIGFSALF